MNEQKIKEQVSLLNEDIQDRLENIAAIRGEGYAAFVNIAINLLEVHRAAALLCREECAEVVHEMVSGNCTSALHTLADLLEFTDAQVEEALKMADSITEQIHTNMERVMK